QHALAFDGSTVLIGNDGGVYASAGSFMANLNSNLDISQFYEDLAVYGDGQVIAGGLQDNGTAISNGQSQWSETIAGDGGYNAINPLDPAQQFGEADTFLYSTNDSWTTSPRLIEPTQIYDGPMPKIPGGPDPSIPANFVPPMTIVPNTASIDNPTVYYGGENLYESTNPSASRMTWKRVTNHAGSFVSAITVAPGDANVVYVGFDDGTVLVSDNATSATPTFSDITPGGIPLWITHIAVQPSAPGSIAITYSNNNTQYQAQAPLVLGGTVSLGSPSVAVGWSNDTGNLPSGISSNSVVFDGNYLVVATDVGVFFTKSVIGNATVWYTAGTGLPNVQVIGLTEDSAGNLYAATHGRGVWKLTLG
ncbi:MAG TPA: hypothetical protein VGS21_03300, partial [Acidimicrobiales bacterium]|nr:hypothetical protein [Acidimicrobiales bacterium]